MLALYHLLRGEASVDQMEGAGQILNEAEVNELPTARFAIIVGTALNPARTQKVNGIATRTLWGKHCGTARWTRWIRDRKSG